MEKIFVWENIIFLRGSTFGSATRPAFWLRGGIKRDLVFRRVIAFVCGGTPKSWIDYLSGWLIIAHEYTLHGSIEREFRKTKNCVSVSSVFVSSKKTYDLWPIMAWKTNESLSWAWKDRERVMMFAQFFTRLWQRTIRSNNPQPACCRCFLHGWVYNEKAKIERWLNGLSTCRWMAYPGMYSRLPLF